MEDFFEIVPVRPILEAANVDCTNRNFEDVYSSLCGETSFAGVRQQLELAVWDYFASLALPNEPTIYDYLVMSLRSKDVIATFNWDPFLVQAVRRNGIAQTDLPHLLFLHGNVKIGFCAEHNALGVIGDLCRQCAKPLAPSKLLFPIKDKNYEDDLAIKKSWEIIKDALSAACMLTIYGYGAPGSDSAAIELFREGWGDPEERALEQVEIVDIRPQPELVSLWSAFIHSHHYEIHDKFWDSSIFSYPRRTGEAAFNQHLGARFVDRNQPPENVTLEELRAWFRPLLEAE